MTCISYILPVLDDLSRLHFEKRREMVLRLHGSIQAHVNALLQHAAMIHHRPAVYDAPTRQHTPRIHHTEWKSNTPRRQRRHWTHVCGGMHDGRQATACCRKSLQPLHAAMIVTEGGIELRVVCLKACEITASTQNLRPTCLVIQMRDFSITTDLAGEIRHRAAVAASPQNDEPFPRHDLLSHRFQTIPMNHSGAFLFWMIGRDGPLDDLADFLGIGRADRDEFIQVLEEEFRVHLNGLGDVD